MIVSALRLDHPSLNNVQYGGGGLTPQSYIISYILKTITINVRRAFLTHVFENACFLHRSLCMFGRIMGVLWVGYYPSPLIRGWWGLFLCGGGSRVSGVRVQVRACLLARFFFWWLVFYFLGFVLQKWAHPYSHRTWSLMTLHVKVPLQYNFFVMSLYIIYTIYIYMKLCAWGESVMCNTYIVAYIIYLVYTINIYIWLHPIYMQ